MTREQEPNQDREGVESEASPDAGTQSAGFVEVNDSLTGDHLVIKNGPPEIVSVPPAALFGSGQDELITYGTGSEVQGLILPPDSSDGRGEA